MPTRPLTPTLEATTRLRHKILWLFKHAVDIGVSPLLVSCGAPHPDSGVPVPDSSLLMAP